MNYKPIICGKTLIEIERSRYDNLLKTEKELEILKHTLSMLSGYSDVSMLKKIFSIKEEPRKGVNDNAIRNK